MITLNVNSLENAEIFWKELGLENDIALNEVFDDTVQKLAIPVAYLDDIFDKVVELGLSHSPITPCADGQYMFSFVAPEDNVFVLIGDWVKAPFTGQMRTAFLEQLKTATVLTPAQVLDLINQNQTQWLLFGRVTCPWTRYFVRQNPELAGLDLAYVDTENTDLDSTLQQVREHFQVATVPSLVKLNPDGSFEKFDSSQQSLADFIK